MTKKERRLKKQFKQLTKGFSQALVQKLLANERKYHFGSAWSIPDWEQSLQRQLVQHVQKGDPRDAGIYAMFAHYHGWPVSAPMVPETERFIQFPEANDVLRAAPGTEDHVSDLPIWRGKDSGGFPVVISCLALSPEERVEAFLKGRVYIGHLGHTHSPVFVHVLNPFVYTPSPKEEAPSHE